MGKVARRRSKLLGIVAALVLAAWALLAVLGQPAEPPANHAVESMPAEKPMKLLNGHELHTSVLNKPMKLTKSMRKFHKAAVDLREQFDQRYGGRKYSAELLRDAVQTFDLNRNDKSEIEFRGQSYELGKAYTAFRLLSALVNKKPFVVAFAGYSTTVGRGNHLKQSYPLVFGELLKAPMMLLGLPDFKVRNAAIGGIPSFPYGWCLSNFLGEDADVVTWEFGKNEQSKADGLDSFIRYAHALSSGKIPPKFMLMDDSKSRVDLMKKYKLLKQRGFMTDSIAVNVDTAIKPLLAREGAPPAGVNDWDAWGANSNCPGRSKWHIKRQGHELRAWVLAMHFLDAMELAADVLEAGTLNDFLLTVGGQNKGMLQQLPEPITTKKGEFGTLRFGERYRRDKPLNAEPNWQMNHVSCRTSFDPVLNGYLRDIVQSPVQAQKDLLTDRDESLIERGWVWDVGLLERKTKLKVNAVGLGKCGGLGYIDMKMALYGIHSSGKLSLWLPSSKGRAATSVDDTYASGHYKSLVICEVNEKREGAPCDMENDMEVTVGGKKATSIRYMSFTGVEYLGRNVCINVRVPEGAKLDSRGSVTKEIGLPVDIVVTNRKLTQKGACSISHVVWEETRLVG